MLEKKHAGRTSKRPDIDTLSNLYAEMSAHEIAVMYGVADATVRRWIAEYRKDIEQQKSAGEKQFVVLRSTKAEGACPLFFFMDKAGIGKYTQKTQL